MKGTQCRLIHLLLIICIALPVFTLAESSVPTALPTDLGGKTLYGYLMDLKNLHMPAAVFRDAAKYSDQDRDNARRASNLIIDATTGKMEEADKPDQYMLYLRGYAYDLQFQDNKDPAFQIKALADYKETIALGGTYAQADYDRLASMQVQAAPLAWQVPQILTLEELGKIIGVSGGNLFHVKSTYQREDGNRLGAGYALRSVQNPDQSAVFVLVDPQGGKARYDILKRHAFLNKTTEIQGLGDEAVLLGLRNMENNPLLYTTALMRRDNLVLQVRVPDFVWRGPGFNFDPAKTAKDIAVAFLANLYDTGRSVPDMNAVTLEDVMPSRRLPAGTAESPVPDQIPQDLGGKTTYGYITELRKEFLPKNVFTDAKYGENDRNNARRALGLIVDTISQGFDQNGMNPYELEIRGACYAAAYEDTNDPAFRMLAINDYKQALSLGFKLVKPDYDRLASSVILGMTELSDGAAGGHVFRLQAWLIQAGFLQGSPSGTFDDVTRHAVESFEKDAGLTPDGIADIAFMLTLYSRIDDGDALFLSK